ncbi:MAG: hypothetical protein A2V70_14940 [Planctomycetes bacterium RBG_13_63_9]|nr:MAG: hypothetical protein A2V70_14940 [Planctomycetes bacterium RBG_13_63_9]
MVRDSLELLEVALQRLPDPPWRIAQEADIYDCWGDLYAEMGNLAQATQQYQKAIALYPTSDQPYGRHLLHRRAAKVQAKLDLLTVKAIESGALRDGTYTGKSLGYVGDVTVTVTIRAGKITDVRVQHEEKIDQKATTIIPQRIIAAQSLKVDGITGVTVTYDAIIDGALQALRRQLPGLVQKGPRLVADLRVPGPVGLRPSVSGPQSRPPTGLYYACGESGRKPLACSQEQSS